MPPTCPLCHSHTTPFHNIKNRDYFQCTNCQAILLHPEQYMTAQDEEKHYRFHNNDVTDAGYLHFVSPITQGILHDFSPSHSGLDFGAGTGSAVSKVLNDNGYAIVSYDPFFHPFPEALTKAYDYIACCEVIEHFHHPAKEFELLYQLLQPQGKLYCMTHLYSPEIDFEKWYYKNDTTHVFMYQKETMEWIKETYGFSEVTIENRLIVFQK
ncbi:class I SAM-dependent methyltransferase [Flavobacterium sp.]|uniref:class I SAM-dependent methyltransferase n=1 Tax=Flavobacterium sp. TaxID=239 RepID=UPI003D0C31F7